MSKLFSLDVDHECNFTIGKYTFKFFELKKKIQGRGNLGLVHKFYFAGLI